MKKTKYSNRRTKRILIGTFGGVLLFFGIIMIPYPGPGWLVVFASLALLGREFHWARRLLRKVKRYYDRWIEWVTRQPALTQFIFWCGTATLVVTTIWLLNGYGFLHQLIYPELEADWLHSPFFI